LHYSMIKLAGCRRHGKGLLRSAETAPARWV
jgi:hypothetical protein